MNIPKDKLEFFSLSVSWILLLLLTVIAIIFSQIQLAASTLIILALVITVIKSHLIVDIYMGLKVVDNRWRGLMLAYIVLIPLIMGLIYLSA